ncbi:MAG: sulfite exporter TauE/SafE family protein [Anaerolineae bacterium]|nr:sulfite exporter TauE/SafE family protein [Anaerolineae bacterium]
MVSLLLGFLIGASLGLLGGGGSILTVPALVYLVGQQPQVAVTTSLAIVGTNSLLGAYLHQAQGTVNWRAALIFGGVGMAVSYLSANLSKHLSPHLLMVAFAVLMLVVGNLLLHNRAQQRQQFRFSAWKLIGSGVIVGLLTGFLGVGGGFLIVPALVMLIGLPMHEAVGTSLVIIALNSAAGFAGHLNGQALEMETILAFLVAGIGGTFVGVRFGKHLDPLVLRRIFALFVIALAVLLLIDNLPKLG